MGWRGTLRTINAAANRAARESERQHKAELKAQIADESAEAVYLWEQRLSELVSFHKEDVDRIDWQSISQMPEPSRPTPDASNTVKAKSALDSFKPGLRHKLFGGTERKVTKLKSKLDKAVEKDRELHKQKAAKYQQAYQEWQTDVTMANRVIAGDAQALKEVLGENQTLSNQPLLGASISFDIGKNYIHAKPVVHDIEVVPDFRRKQLASGRLSETNMPKGERADIYQDYVCSVALRVAKEVFAMLPIPEVQVTCYANMLNTSTGYKEDTPILTVHVVRPTFDSLNLRRIDPSDALSNFNHDMNFKKSTGFSAIQVEGVE